MKISPFLTCKSIALVAILLATTSLSYGQVYRWVDRNGVTHYTDNPQNIPDQYRKNLKDSPLPEIMTYTDKSKSGSAAPTGEKNERDELLQSKIEGEEQLKKSIETLRSQIKAKEDLIRYVDERRNLAINPYRNRIISEKELELYDRYKEELPEDEHNMEVLQMRLSTFEDK